jgi:hypothetical protein
MDWRRRATEMRKFADETRDRHAKETMLSIAHDYDLLALQVEFQDQLRRELVEGGSPQFGQRCR